MQFTVPPLQLFRKDEGETEALLREEGYCV